MAARRFRRRAVQEYSRNPLDRVAGLAYHPALRDRAPGATDRPPAAYT